MIFSHLIRNGFTLQSTFIATLLISFAMLPRSAQANDSTPSLKSASYDVIWDSPSADSTGSMPIGTGIAGANVWVTPDGTIHMLLSRTDSWSEICRLLKVGELEIQCSPNPFADSFRQTLSLENGQILLKGAGGSIAITPIHGTGKFSIKGWFGAATQVRAHLYTWRTEPHTLTKAEENSAWTMMGAPFPLTESADTTLYDRDFVSVLHYNPTSIVDFTLKHQGIEQFSKLVGDPLLHRGFGSSISGDGFSQVSAGILGKSNADGFSLTLATATIPDTTLRHLVLELRQESKAISDEEINESKQFWHKFWQQSYIEVTAPEDADEKTKADCYRISQDYALQRFVMAGAGLGAYPFKFNGSIYTIKPTWTHEPYDNDWRKWGDEYWWQNTRLPYWAMVGSGDFAGMEPLFKMYENMMPICEARTKFYYNAKGLYFPETVSLFGTYSNSDYGWDRKPNQPANDFDCAWWKYAANQGLELVQMMLDRYNAQPDTAFKKHELLPMARQVLLYFATRYPRDEEGRLKIDPDQCVETYRAGTINDTPVIAGLHAVLSRLLKLKNIDSEDKANWVALQKILPPVTVKDGKILPAQKFSDERFNIENPEFYAIWPFRLFGVGRGNEAIAQKTFDERLVKDDYGWQYDGQTAALSGLANEAKKSLIDKSNNSNKHFRFPAMWGPNYDWLPDQTHGGNLMLTLQSMILQTVDGKTLIGKAWPQGWNVKFKLYSTAGKVVEGSIIDGKTLTKTSKP